MTMPPVHGSAKDGPLPPTGNGVCPAPIVGRMTLALRQTAAHGESEDSSMPKFNNGSVTLGWDSVDSGVDECELVMPTFEDRGLTPKPSEPDTSGYDRLVDIGNIISRGKRDVQALHRIVGQYDLRNVDANVAMSKITSETLKTAGNVILTHVKTRVGHIREA
jgi:hypothetical protein